MQKNYSVSSLDLRAPLIAKLRRGLGIGWLRVITVVMLDTLMLSLAWLIAEKLGTSTHSFNLLWNASEKQNGLLLPILIINLGILAASGLYGTDDRRRSFLNLIKSLILSQIVLLNLAFFYGGDLVVSRSTFLIAWALSLIFVFAERLMLHLAIVNQRSHGSWRQAIFIIGDPKDMEKAKSRLEKAEQFDIKGEIDLSVRSNSEAWAKTLENIQKLGVSEVFICSWHAVKDPIFLFWELKNVGIDLRVLPLGLDLPSQWSEIKMIDGFTTIRFRSPPIVGSDFWIKRGFDILTSGVALICISPVFLIIAIAIKLNSIGPVFYKQERVGLKGRRFKVWKFRTMVINAADFQQELEDKNEMKGGVLFKMKNDPRITSIGRFLRRYSLDELPQLINVLCGTMSLVGPRPLPVRDVERFSEHHQIRHEVLPGITGLWQISGRSDVGDSEDVFRLDMAYIQNWSLALDFQILMETIKVVINSEGAY